MAPKPVDPVRGYSFVAFQASQPATPLPADQIEVEVDKGFTTTKNLIDWVETSLNDDGTIKSGAIGEDQLDPDILSEIGADSAAAAAASASSAAASAAQAGTYATDAQAAADAADGSAVLAGSYVGQASAAATAALGYRDQAQVYASQAESSDTSAENHANHAEESEGAALNSAALSEKWATYLGGPVAGGLYSSYWYSLQRPPGDEVSVVPFPPIAADNVQDALEEIYTTLDAGKANTVHTHVKADITDFFPHAHASGDISDFNEAVADRMNATLVQGANVVITYDDTAGTIEIAGAAGGGGGGATTAGELLFAPTGLIAATNTQAAVVETYTESARAIHSHVSTDINDFIEAVGDRMAATLVGSSTIMVTYDDAANTITLTSDAVANEVPFTPTGTIAATNVQAAIAEVSTELLTDIALKANIASPALIGTPTAPTAAALTNTTQLATTAFVTAADTALAATKANTAHTHAQADITNLVADLGLKAPLASPALTGTPTAPTPALATNTTQLATTAFVASLVNTYFAVKPASGAANGVGAVVGTWSSVAASGTSYTLPAGGTWAYIIFGLGLNTATHYWVETIAVGVAAGSTLLYTYAPVTNTYGLVWRVA